MKRFLGLIALLLVGSPAWAQVNIAGNLRDLAGNNVSASNTYVQFVLRNYGTAIPRITGTNAFVDPIPPVFRPNGSGLITGAIIPNDVISPFGTYYSVCIFHQGFSQWCNNFIIYTSSQPWNLNLAAPLVVIPPAPAKNVTVAQSFLFTQATPATTWTITHDFGNNAVITECFDLTNKLLWPDAIVNTSNNVTTVTFVAPQTGQCLLMNNINVSVTNQVANAVITNPVGNQNIVGYQFTHNGNSIPDIGSPWTWTATQTFPGTIFSGEIQPAVTDTQTVGDATHRWTGLYLGNGVAGFLQPNAGGLLQWNGDTVGTLTYPGVFTNKTYRTLNNTPITARNAANNADLPMISVNALNQTQIGQDNAITTIGPTGLGNLVAGQMTLNGALRAAVNLITYSTTPALDMSLGTVQQFACTTPTAAINPTTANLFKGETLTVIFVQNGTTACTWTWPATVHGGGTVSATLSSINVQEFIVSNSGTDLYAKAAMVSVTGGTP